MKRFVDNEKNAYIQPELDVIVLSDNDVVVTSGGGDGIIVPDINFGLDLVED